MIKMDFKEFLSEFAKYNKQIYKKTVGEIIKYVLEEGIRLRWKPSR